MVQLNPAWLQLLIRVVNSCFGMNAGRDLNCLIKRVSTVAWEREGSPRTDPVTFSGPQKDFVPLCLRGRLSAVSFCWPRRHEDAKTFFHESAQVSVIAQGNMFLRRLILWLSVTLGLFGIMSATSYFVRSDNHGLPVPHDAFVRVGFPFLMLESGGFSHYEYISWWAVAGNLLVAGGIAGFGLSICYSMNRASQHGTDS